MRKDGDGNGPKIKGKAEKAAKKSTGSSKVARAEIPADKTNKSMKEVAPKGGKGKQAALTKVTLIIA